MQNVWHALCAVLLEPHVGIHIIQFRPQEVAYHRSVALAVDGYDNTSFVLKKVRTDDSARPKSAPNSDFLGMHLVLMYLVWIVIVPNPTILFINISIHPKMGFVAKNDFFGEIWVNFQLHQSPISKYTAFSMVIYLMFLGQLDFIRVQTQVLTQNSPSSCERREIDCLGVSCTFSRTAAMFSVDLAFR